MSIHRLRRYAIIASLGVAAALVLSVSPAEAQSPVPNSSFKDVKPGAGAPGTPGIVVEALGMFSCSYSLSSAESATVNFINSGSATITEISPQSGCGSLSQYESGFASIASYVEAHAPHYSTLWGGIMVDEEPSWGFTVSQLISMNSSLASTMANVPGIPWWYAENATWSGAWSQTDYDHIQNASTTSTANAAESCPQIYNSYMVGIANNSGSYGMMVTWNGNAQYPFNSETYADGQINGWPYNQQFGTNYNFQWDNHWVRA